MVKNPPVNAGRLRRPAFGPWVEKTPLEGDTETHSNILARRTPWTEEPARLQSTGSHRVGYK